MIIIEVTTNSLKNTLMQIIIETRHTIKSAFHSFDVFFLYHNTR